MFYLNVILQELLGWELMETWGFDHVQIYTTSVLAQNFIRTNKKKKKKQYCHNIIECPINIIINYTQLQTKKNNTKKIASSN